MINNFISYKKIRLLTSISKEQNNIYNLIYTENSAKGL